MEIKISSIELTATFLLPKMSASLHFFTLKLYHHGLRMAFNLLDSHSLDYSYTTLNSLSLASWCYLISRRHVCLHFIIFSLNSKGACVMHFKIIIDFTHLKILHSVYWIHVVFSIFVVHGFHETTLWIILVFLIEYTLVSSILHKKCTSASLVRAYSIFYLHHAIIYAIVTVVLNWVSIMAICWTWIQTFVHRHDLNFTSHRCWTSIIAFNLIY